MSAQPTRAEWATADEFASLVERLFASHRMKALRVVATLAASSPEALEQARNVLKNRALLLAEA